MPDAAVLRHIWGFGPNGGCMGRHRDNFKSSDAVDALIRGKDVLKTSTGHAISADGSSQTPLSDVLVWTSRGSFPMKIHLSFPSRPHQYLAHCTAHATLYTLCMSTAHPSLTPSLAVSVVLML